MRNRPNYYRVIVDANLWISYLLPPSQQDRTVDKLMALFVDGKATLVMPEDLIEEVRETIARKPRLSRRITLDQFDFFIETTHLIGENLPALEGEIPPATRDPKDDYLLAHALLSDVDLLISGDADLLSLRDHLERPLIMTAREVIDLFDGT